MGCVWKTLLAATVVFVFAQDARANDSSANQTTGGLVLSKTDAIAMRSEELRISLERIEVRYEFQNVTDRDVTLTVAFPLPDLTPDFINMAMDKDIIGEEFETSVDGVPIRMQAERKALLDGKDVTAKLSALGLSPDPTAVDEKLQEMPRAKAEELEKKLIAMGLVGGGPDRFAWTYRRRFYREQVFPAGKTVVVTHKYKPSVGSTFSIPVYDYGPDDTSSRKERAKYCIDKDIADTIKAKEGKGYIFIARYVDYILSTGANWAGGKIGDFRLVVDKGSPENYVAFCGTGIRKLDGTQFEMRKRDFQPTGELNVVFFHGEKQTME